MKSLGIVLIVISLLFSNTITVKIHNIKFNKGGNIRIMVSDLESWEKRENIDPRYQKVFPVRDSVLTITFKDIELPKEYSIKAYHDENSNEKVDFKWLPIPFPKEGFAFTRDYIPSGFPKFEKSKIFIDQDTSIDLYLVYGRKDAKK